MTISGLLTVKPANTPKVGDIRCYTVENRTAQSGNTWNKIKGATPDNGGKSYKVLTVKPTGRTDQYGNISLNIEIEPSQISDPRGEMIHNLPAQMNGTPQQDERSRRIERQHSEEMAIRYAALKGLTDIDTEDLRQLIDWFARDIGHVPQKVTNPTPDDEYDSDEPF